MVNTGDTAWILTSAALVLLMTPCLALFYGGMVRAKSVLNMMMMSFGALALIGNAPAWQHIAILMLATPALLALAVAVLRFSEFSSSAESDV